MGLIDQWRNAISSIESAGSGGYSAVGPDTGNGHHAYGKYQVMGFNIPAWSQKYYGQSLTPQQFIANNAAQDAVFNGQFGGYAEKYGNPQDAASMWFSGHPMANNTASDGGINVPEYIKRFNAALGMKAMQPSMPVTTPSPDMGGNQSPTGLLGQQIQDAQQQASEPSILGPRNVAPLHFAQRDNLAPYQQFIKSMRELS